MKRGRKPTCDCGVCKKCIQREYSRKYRERHEVKKEQKFEKKKEPKKIVKRHQREITRILVINDIGIPIKTNCHIEGFRTVIVNVSLGSPDEPFEKQQYHDINKLDRRMVKNLIC